MSHVNQAFCKMLKHFVKRPGWLRDFISSGNWASILYIVWNLVVQIFNRLPKSNLELRWKKHKIHTCYVKWNNNINMFMLINALLYIYWQWRWFLLERVSSGVARDMCMGGTGKAHHIYGGGAHKNGTRNNNIYILYMIYIHGRIEVEQGGVAPQKKSIKM